MGIGSSTSRRNACMNWHRYTACLTVLACLMYSASVVDIATTDCLFDCYEMGPLARKKTYLNVDLLSSNAPPAKSVLVYTCRLN
jgi:hypothetical protein